MDRGRCRRRGRSVRDRIRDGPVRRRWRRTGTARHRRRPGGALRLAGRAGAGCERAVPIRRRRGARVCDLRSAGACVRRGAEPRRQPAPSGRRRRGDRRRRRSGAGLRDARSRDRPAGTPSRAGAGRRTWRARGLSGPACRSGGARVGSGRDPCLCGADSRRSARTGSDATSARTAHCPGIGCRVQLRLCPSAAGLAPGRGGDPDLFATGRRSAAR